MEEKSFYVTYVGNIEEDLEKFGINKYIIINSNLALLYVPVSFQAKVLNQIKTIKWWNENRPMSPMISLDSNTGSNYTIRNASGVDYIYNNSFNDVTGRDILIGVIDSGVDYLHPDLIDEFGNSKILTLWDQESTLKPPPGRFLFGSEFSREEINEAIRRQDPSLSEDRRGTGTIVSGILVGQGNINPAYVGVATGAELVVVKLREYQDEYYEDKYNYTINDFLAAIAYIIEVAGREWRDVIINFTVGARSSFGYVSVLNTWPEMAFPGVIFVSGAGDQRNTYIHYAGKFENQDSVNDIIFEFGDGDGLDIFVEGAGIDRIDGRIISPSGEMSYNALYAPDYYEYTGKFNLEDTTYMVRYFYPWASTGSELLEINLRNMKPGSWTLRLTPNEYSSGEYHVYLPNRNLMSNRDGFIDSDSFSNITLFGYDFDVITVGAYDNRYDSMWVGSSRGPVRAPWVKPDIAAAGVNIISTFPNKAYRPGTGTGISSSIVSGILALIMEYIKQQSPAPKFLLFPQPLKTYLMLGAERRNIYNFPNDSFGYGVVNFKNTIQKISENL
ncbi:MAG: S8 family peptidase [Clostridioides sp.]|nr:S8 family peptidase [Clostridioides sp.]